jgi:hypothetical protein
MLWRCAAGVLLGLPLCIVAVATLIRAWPGSSEGSIVPMLVLFFPLWTGVIAASFLFRDGARAWAWLGTGNIAAFAVFFLVRHTMPGLS